MCYVLMGSVPKVQVLTGHKDWISCCCVSPDCSMVASVGRFDRVSGLRFSARLNTCSYNNTPGWASMTYQQTCVS